VQAQPRRYRQRYVTAQATAERRNSVRHSRWQRQDGLIRESLKFALVIVIVGVLVLDVVSVINASLGVRQNAADAADQALTTLIQTNNPTMAMQSASTFLKLHGSFLVKAGSNVATSVQGPGHATVTITATRKPHTYVFHYFQSLPWGIGPWFHQILNPRSTQTNS
jgi:hypothetical protein